MDGRGHAAARWPRQAHGSRDAQRRARGEGFLRCGDAREPRSVMGSEPNGERPMMHTGWSFVEAAARLLARDEREAVLGDLLEADENALQGLFGVIGLVFRRETALWKRWQPWLAGFGVALPSSFLLMGFSLS